MSRRGTLPAGLGGHRERSRIERVLSPALDFRSQAREYFCENGAPLFRERKSLRPFGRTEPGRGTNRRKTSAACGGALSSRSVWERGSVWKAWKREAWKREALKRLICAVRARFAPRRSKRFDALTLQ